jgi:hypothetical protein
VKNCKLVATPSMESTFGKKKIAASSSMPVSCHQRSPQRINKTSAKETQEFLGLSSCVHRFGHFVLSVFFSSCVLRRPPSSWHWQLRTNFHEKLAFYQKRIGRAPATFLSKNKNTRNRLRWTSNDCFCIQLPEYSFTGNKKLIITTEGPSAPVQSSPQAPHQILSTKEHQLLNCEKAFTWHRQ